jgi:hypothetical protein
MAAKKEKKKNEYFNNRRRRRRRDEFYGRHNIQHNDTLQNYIQHNDKYNGRAFLC